MSAPESSATAPDPVRKAIRSGGGARPPNIVLVVLDCARAKNLVGSHASELVARTPAMRAMAEQGTVFERAVAPANWTIPSHMSFFTGSYPSGHGLRTFRHGAAPEETVAAWLRRRGYDTGLFSEMVHLVGGYGLEDGFEHRFARHIGITDEQRTTANRLAGSANVLYSEEVRRLLARLPPCIVPMNAFNHPQEVTFKREVCNDSTIDAFDRWLAGRSSERPFFAFLNFVDAHEPYPPVENGHRMGPLARWYARTPRYYLLAVEGLQSLVPWEFLVRGYLQTLEEADRKIERVARALSERGVDGRTLIVVTADHGQSFGESGNVYHGCGATESIARVPLIVRPPSELSLPRTVARWTSLCEIPSWLKAVASGRAPFDEEGHAPFPFRAGAPDATIVYCEGAPASDPNRSLQGIRLDQMWNHRLLAAYRGEEKHVLDLSTGAIYRSSTQGDADGRPAERLDAKAAEAIRPELFGRYEAAESERRARSSEETDGLSVDLRGRLRSWGYG
jgi:arylsulfatase A-like enzyme